MDVLPVMIKILMITGGIFLIILLMSLVISKFRKEEKAVVESIPAKQYDYFHDDSNQYPVTPQDYIQEEVYVPQEIPYGSTIDKNYFNRLRSEQSPTIFQQPVYEYDLNEDWGEQEEYSGEEEPLRKTSGLNFDYNQNKEETLTQRMTVINEVPVIRYGWEQ